MPISDKFHHIVQKLIEKERPQTAEDLQKLLNTLVGKTPEQMPFLAESDADKALELVWQARELPPAKGKRLAEKALKLNPDCIEAHEYIGNTYAYYHKSGPHFEKGVEIGRRIFGGEFLKKNKGHFWGVTETRPFMRCMAQLAECYRAPGQTKKAIPNWQEMLDLNPNDNQGIRYHLLPALLEIKDLASFKKYRKKYREDSAMMYFNDALAAFMENGETDTSNSKLHAAIGNNRFVPPLLLATYPPDDYPDSYSWHSEEEALIYVHAAWRAWLWAEGAKDWLRKRGRTESLRNGI